MAKLEYEKATGVLIERAQVQKGAFRTGRMIRDTLLGLPDRLAGVIASEPDQKKIHALLTKELHQVLEPLTPAASRHCWGRELVDPEQRY